MASELALIKEIDRLDKVNTTLKQKAKAGVGQAMELGSAIGGAAVAGYAQGRYGWEIAGLSTSETAAIGLVVVGLSGIAGKRYSRLLMEAAKGAGGFAVWSMRPTTHPRAAPWARCLASSTWPIYRLRSLAPAPLPAADISSSFPPLVGALHYGLQSRN